MFSQFTGSALQKLPIIAFLLLRCVTYVITEQCVCQSTCQSNIYLHFIPDILIQLCVSCHIDGCQTFRHWMARLMRGLLMELICRMLDAVKVTWMEYESIFPCLRVPHNSQNHRQALARFPEFGYLKMSNKECSPIRLERKNMILNQYA